MSGDGTKDGHDWVGLGLTWLGGALIYSALRLRTTGFHTSLLDSHGKRIETHKRDHKLLVTSKPRLYAGMAATAADFLKIIKGEH